MSAKVRALFDTMQVEMFAPCSTIIQNNYHKNEFYRNFFLEKMRNYLCNPLEFLRGHHFWYLPNFS